MKALSNSELTTFCGQFALILRSGISSLEGLSIMIEDTPEGEGRQLLENLLHEVELTGSLFPALETVGCFPSYMCSMVELGEQSGRLDDVMQNLSDHYRREEILSKSIKSAVTYPLIMLGMMIIIMTVLIVRVLPLFHRVFEQLGAGLTGFSGTILRLGQSMSKYSLVFIALFLMAAVAFLYFFYTQKGRSKLSGFSTRFFVTRHLSEKIACSRFASGMYLALSSGLDVDHSLEMVARLVDHPIISEKITLMQKKLAEGISFQDAATESEIFSGIYLRMIHIGFKTGAMDDVMREISIRYDEDIQEQMDRMVSRLEPTLVAILSIAVGMILLSVMLPLMGIMSNMG